MASVVISGDTSGTATLQAQAVAGNTTLTLPTTSGTLITTASGQTLTSPTITGAVMNSMASSVITSGTAQASTSVTSINFTGIPSWVKRITVMFSGVSTNGTSILLIQIGSGSITNTGYISQGANGSTSVSQTTGFGLGDNNTAALTYHGNAVLNLISANTWTFSSSMAAVNKVVIGAGGSPALAGALDRIRITTVNGTDLFDAGTINILYE